MSEAHAIDVDNVDGSEDVVIDILEDAELVVKPLPEFDAVQIHGVTYAGDVFRAMAFPSPGKWYQFERSGDNLGIKSQTSCPHCRESEELAKKMVSAAGGFALATKALVKRNSEEDRSKANAMLENGIENVGVEWSNKYAGVISQGRKIKISAAVLTKHIKVCNDCTSKSLCSVAVQCAASMSQLIQDEPL